VAFEMIPNSIRTHSAVFFWQFSESVFLEVGSSWFRKGRGEGWNGGGEGGPHRPRPLGPILVILELCGSPDEVGWPRKVFPGWIGPGPARWPDSLPGGIFFPSGFVVNLHRNLSRCQTSNNSGNPPSYTHAHAHTNTHCPCNPIGADKESRAGEKISVEGVREFDF